MEVYSGVLFILTEKKLEWEDKSRQLQLQIRLHV